MPDVGDIRRGRNRVHSLVANWFRHVENSTVVILCGRVLCEKVVCCLESINKLLDGCVVTVG